MNQTLTIAKRELTSLFYSPIAYIVLGLFSLGTTLFFLMNFQPGQEASLRATLFWVVWLMIFLLPAVSMRLISEEFRAGTIEPLMTSPVSDAQVVLGKWLGAMGFYAVLLLPLAVFTAVLEFNGRPDYGPIATGVVGLLLVGGLYLAIGTFASAATQNQIIAFLMAFFIICVFSFGMYFLPNATTYFGPGTREALFYLNVNTQFDAFNKGLVDTRNFVYFISGIGLFLFWAVLLLQSRRWR